MAPSHHGSQTDCLEAFVRAVNSQVAVFSVQRDGRFGHPHLAVVERYQKLYALVFRTDMHGAITFRTDGHSVWIAPYAGQPVLLPTAAHPLAEMITPPPAAGLP